jgi:predicted nucleotidyltransferase
MATMAGGTLDEIVSRYALSGVKAATTVAQEGFIQRAKEVLAADERVLAAYLVGGFAIGKADPWSDVDLQVIVADEAAEDLKTSWSELAGRLAPLANVKSFQFTIGGVCITPDWLHFDVAFHARSQVDPMKIEGMSPLLDKAGLLPDRAVPRPDRREAPFFPEAAVDMFLYMLGNMVSVVGRNEPIPATNGVIMVRDVALVGLLLAEQGWRSTREHSAGNPFPFTKHLRSYLSDEQNALLASLPPVEPTIDSAIDGYLALARIFLPRARRLAEQTGHAWPQAYEKASVAHFERSLGVNLQTYAMPPRSAGEVLRMMVDAFNTGSSDSVEMIVDGDYVDHQGLAGQSIRGPSGFKAVVVAARSGYRTLDVTVEELIESEDHAAARLRWRGTRMSGQSDERETIEWIRVRREMAVEHWGGRC